ncbi:Transcriptional regulator (plasmid) [Sinomonas atrocyanea]|uniref:Transcriptional regulator n=1 Tax=Sinomonas atrocyanea TaxID=37927 RepID=A0A127A5S9_9MICC|nr:GNAT family N-acetyltransferase [Sinomonas atrocyanea]AMM34799.1 Transcriptional regulator [Sinomonas atrocyanea]GEB64624.1 GNAT family acetyltransferase [Sinomonas atrocyanea]
MLASLNLPVALETRSGEVTLRRAAEDDLDELMGLLSDDPTSAARGDVAAAGDRAAYRRALAEILADPSNEVVVVEDGHGAIVGTMQLTRIPGMARRGATRLLIEAVRVSSARRSSGIGTAMMEWAVGPAAESIAVDLVQMTSDAARGDAHRFYERLGFAGSHIGFKYRVH